MNVSSSAVALLAPLERVTAPKVPAVMAAAGVDAQMLERARAAYARDVAVLPAQQVAGIIQAAGFDAPVQFFQAGLMHGWVSRRAADA